MFICSHCGSIQKSTGLEIDSGCELTCTNCGEKTIVLLCTPAQYTVAVEAIRYSEESPPPIL